MAETPAYGTPPLVNDGYVTDRRTAEQIWDSARREAREELEQHYKDAGDAARDAFVTELAEQKQRHDEREAQWRRLVEVLEGPKSAPGRASEIARLKENLGL